MCNDRECGLLCLTFMKFTLYFSMASAIYFTSMIGITGEYSYDLVINNNTQYAFNEHVGPPETYGAVFIGSLIMYISGITCVIYMGCFQKADLIGYVSSLMFWFSFTNLFFVGNMENPQSVALRCNNTCEFDSLESDYLEDISSYMLITLIISLVMICKAGVMSSNSVDNGCDPDCNNPVLLSIWYLWFPVLMWFIPYILCSNNSDGNNSVSAGSYSTSNVPVANSKYDQML